MSNNPHRSKKIQLNIVSAVLLVIIIASGAYFRFSGLTWGEYQYLHPDERFLIWVGTDISPVNSLAEYFDTANSSLNPHNRGHGFYVYGTLPMFLARYVVEWIYGHSGFDVMTNVGRALSALADLLTILLVFLVANKLYGQHIALLASAFFSASVLPIQQAHFFTMDTFTTMFSFLALYFSILIITSNQKKEWEDVGKVSNPFYQNEIFPEESIPGIKKTSFLSRFISDSLFVPSLGFGVALGMAVSSKLNAAPMALVLPVAMGIYLMTVPAQNRGRRLVQVIGYLVMAGVFSLLVFRILQPYAFSGPSFLGIKPNPQWVQNIQEQRAQSGGDVDFPPAMQWARRPIWFSFQNMVLWGLGLPLGILAWTGFLWVGWRLGTGWNKDRAEWLSHVLIWGWTAIYFFWQTLQLNPTMRYQMPIYPTLAIFAAWAVFQAYDTLKKRKEGQKEERSIRERFRKGIISPWNALVIGGLILFATYAYAFSFSQIYLRPITRVDASHWIYQNIPGPINLSIQTRNGVTNQIVPFSYDFKIETGIPFKANFKPVTAGLLTHLLLPRVKEEISTNGKEELFVSILGPASDNQPLASARSSNSLSLSNPVLGDSYLLELDSPLQLDPEIEYTLEILRKGDPRLILKQDSIALINPGSSQYSGEVITQTIRTVGMVLHPEVPLMLDFIPSTAGELIELSLPDFPQSGIDQNSGLKIGYQYQHEELIPSEIPINLIEDSSGIGIRVIFTEPLQLEEGEKLALFINGLSGSSAVTLNGVGIANEGDWDDGLPLRIDGYDGFGGIYPRELNFNMYWDDDSEKLDRFKRILNESDFIVISSNRQWGSLPRLPERFPLVTKYYRNLIGCPENYSIEYCYRIAEPGKFLGNLGFELVKVFTSEPRLGPIRINDQFAEEAFTVYDHPKVLIFKKSSDYSPQLVQDTLGNVDFSQVIRVPPMRASSHPLSLMLPEDRWAEQQAGGTWSELFNPNALQNRYPLVAVLIWYLSVGLVGLIVFPIIRFATPGLDDRGYPMARLAGLLLLSYIVWLAGSIRIPFSRTTITFALLLIAAISTALSFSQRRELIKEFRNRSRYYLTIEFLFLLFFVVFLMIRIGNPDLWHPFKGGEKPMDFSYFNAVLKSTSFPPYDPWYAGGYLNYYYYGFLLVGTLVKWLGITPSVAYNLILPTIFGMIALGAFSVVWNLAQKAHASRTHSHESRSDSDLSPYIPALMGAISMAVLGNLGTVRMFYQGFQRLAAPGGIIDHSNLLNRLIWAVQGFFINLNGERLPYSIGDWYWNPSRIIPAAGDIEPITEFPFFTALYADLHAHLIALPVTLLALNLMIGIILGKAYFKNRIAEITWFLFLGLTIGALRPTNTWDFPVYMVLGIIATGYAYWRYCVIEKPGQQKIAWVRNESFNTFRLIRTGVCIIALTALTFFLYYPYSQWYALGYTQIRLWDGTHTPVFAYLSHWGLFLFLILSWMTWETRDWLAKTPVSALNKLSPYKYLIRGALGVSLLLLVGLFWWGIRIAWLVIPIALWAGVLFLWRDSPDAKKIVLFLVGTGLSLTLMVELIVLKGDIGRMNTVFKFYLQVWTMLSLSAAASLGWLLPALEDWRHSWRRIWEVSLAIILAGVLLYPLTATLAKISDRISEKATHSLDGMEFMKHSTYMDEWGEMDLSQDYRAIRWLQENVDASPVIVEANLRNLYRWGSRFSIYTGLPGVVGWEWHQQQQRAVVPGSWISNRIAEIDKFYTTTDLEIARNFMNKYNVRYIILGQQERGHYPGPGLNKFAEANGLLWREVYKDGDTQIYEVIQS